MKGVNDGDDGQWRWRVIDRVSHDVDRGEWKWVLIELPRFWMPEGWHWIGGKASKRKRNEFISPGFYSTSSERFWLIRIDMGGIKSFKMPCFKGWSTELSFNFRLVLHRAHTTPDLVGGVSLSYISKERLEPMHKGIWHFFWTCFSPVPLASPPRRLATHASRRPGGRGGEGGVHTHGDWIVWIVFNWIKQFKGGGSEAELDCLS